MASNGFSVPDDDLGQTAGPTSFAWLQWFQRVQSVVTAQAQSGATVNRPTTVIWVGRRYFDTDLGIPVWAKQVKPVVWVNAAGVVV